MSKKNVVVGRGRPALFSKNKSQKGHVVSLIKRFGLTGARNVLNAAEGSELVQYRSAKLFPEATAISLPTLAKIADEASVERVRGRRPQKATKKAA